MKADGKRAARDTKCLGPDDGDKARYDVTVDDFYPPNKPNKPSQQISIEIRTFYFWLRHGNILHNLYCASWQYLMLH